MVDVRLNCATHALRFCRAMIEMTPSVEDVSSPDFAADLLFSPPPPLDFRLSSSSAMSSMSSPKRKSEPDLAGGTVTQPSSKREEWVYLLRQDRLRSLLPSVAFSSNLLLLLLLLLFAENHQSQVN